MLKKKNTDIGILLIERESWKYFVPSLGEPAVLNISAELISDMEVMSRSSLERQFHNWLEYQKIPCINTVVVLAEKIYFETTLPAKESENFEHSLNSYLDLIPLDDKHVSQFSYPDSTRVFVSNMEILQTIVSLLRQCEVSIHAVLPMSEVKYDFSQGGVKEFIEYVKLNLPTLKAFNLLAEAEYKDPKAEAEEFYSFQMSPKIIGMIVLFVILGALLIFLFMNQQKQNAELEARRAEITNRNQKVTTESTSPTPTPQPTPEVEATSIFADELNISVTYNEVTSPEYLLFIEEIEEAFPDSEISEARARNTRSLVVVSPDVTDEQRQAILTRLIKIDESASIQESPDLEAGNVSVRIRASE